MRTIFDMYASGHTYNQIAKEMNLRGYKTKAGNEFNAASMNSILNNRKYIGEYVYNRRIEKDYVGKANSHKDKAEEDIIRIPDGVPRIIDDETFNKVQNRLQLNKKKVGVYRPASSYLLTGLVYCGECGFHYQGNSRRSGNNNNSVYSSYRCGKTQNHKGGCKNGEIEKNRLENFVIEQLKMHLFTDEAIKNITALVNEHNKEVSISQNDTLISYEKELKNIERKITNLINAIADGVENEALSEKLNALTDSKNELTKRIKDIEEKLYIEIIENDIRKALSKFDEYVKSNNTAEIKAFLKAYIERITIYPDTVEIIFKVASSDENSKSVENINQVLANVEITRDDLKSQPKQKRKFNSQAVNDEYLKGYSITA